ncbi:response regulator transcription factor [Paenibacillus terrigena]|uniref:response regulator transcription factor n=1 Tax=Paenibacillus terrigena TaxID=369333 RepID=UPI00036CB0D2|nr:response regulator transcription factor [Paenibacillus terrigena]
MGDVGKSPVILIVDDEQLIRELVADYLSDEGYSVLQAKNGRDALNILREQAVGLVVLDVMMPGMNGFEVCEELRTFSRAIVIMLTAKSEDEDKISGYECGVDDYVTKPFSPKVLSAKINVLLQRFRAADSALGAGKDDFFVLDEAAMELRIGGEVVALSSKEFEILVYLAKHPNQVLTRDRLLDVIWGFDYYGDARAVDTSIKRLRRKLGVESERIVTVRGSGYKYQT